MAVTYSDFGIEKQVATVRDRIKITHLKRPNSVFSINITFKAGALYQPKPGLAHFVEHMLVKESEKYPSLDVIKRVLSRTAAYANAFTSPDRLDIVASVPSTVDVSLILDMLIDQINTPLMLDEGVGKERSAIQQELRMKEKDISIVNFRNLICLMMNKKGDFIYPTSGSIEQVGKLKKQDLLDYYDTLRRQKVYITSTGSMDIAQLKDYFSQHLMLHNLDELKFNIVSQPASRAVVVRQKDKNKNIILRFGRRIERENYINDIAALRLVIIYLFGQNGLMIERLRHEKGLVYGVLGEDIMFGRFGATIFWTECSKDKLQEVVDTIDQEFDNLQKGEMDVSRINEIKQMLAKKLKSSLEKSFDVTQSFMGSNLGDGLDPVERINAIEKVTDDDIIQVANKYFKMSDMLWSLTGDLSKKDLTGLGIKGEIEFI